jgi:hypothetical protein
MIPEKTVIHEKHEIHEQNQKDIQLHGVSTGNTFVAMLPGGDIEKSIKLRYAAQAKPKIDAARGKKHPFRTETRYRLDKTSLRIYLNQELLQIVAEE